MQLEWLRIITKISVRIAVSLPRFEHGTCRTMVRNVAASAKSFVLTNRCPL
jgi:hypothetical protein